MQVLYEDQHILAINKPAGLVVHSDGRTSEPSVSEWFAENYPESKHVGEPIKLAPRNEELGTTIDRPGIVHRIDRDTSGVLLLAKTIEGHAHLKKQFQNREIKKIYHAFVYGVVKEDKGILDRPIGRSSSDFRKWSAQRGARGELREAITYFEVLNRNTAEGTTLVQVEPKTGRTHQIRVHFTAYNHPVVCDKLYAPKRAPLLGFSRLALHARLITFENVDGGSVTVEAPYPEDFARALDKVA
jgi:23S rRNA pseudouridine1911/1915/1917 synthase